MQINTGGPEAQGSLEGIAESGIPDTVPQGPAEVPAASETTQSAVGSKAETSFAPEVAGSPVPPEAKTPIIPVSPKARTSTKRLMVYGFVVLVALLCLTSLWKFGLLNSSASFHNQSMNSSSNSSKCYNLTVSYGSGGASVSAYPTNSVVCALGYFVSGSMPNITAIAGSGYVFANWTGTLSSGQNPWAYTMPSHSAIETANFAVQVVHRNISNVTVL